MLAGGVGLSLAANLAQAQPTLWGWVVAAVPSAALLIAVSMIERRAARRPRPADRQDDAADEPPAPGRPSPARDAGDEAQDAGDEELLALARSAAAEHRDQHGQPITRDVLCARLGVSNQAASELLRQVRPGQGRQPGAARAACPAAAVVPGVRSRDWCSVPGDSATRNAPIAVVNSGGSTPARRPRAR